MIRNQPDFFGGGDPQGDLFGGAEPAQPAWRPAANQ